MASSIGGSILKSSRAAMATARSMRTGSSWNRSVGIADAADEPVSQILQAAGVVDDRERADVVEQRVDREVAPERVLFGRAERVVAVDQAVARVVDSVVVGGAAAALRRLHRPRPSSSAETSRRNVATSMVFGPKRTCARRNRRPMIQQFRKSFLT